MRLSRVRQWGLWFILGTAVVGTLCLSGLDFYFSRIFPISTKLAQAAITRMQIHHIHPLTFRQIPQTFISAIIATEDRHFYSDPGIDPEGILRAAVVDIQTDSYAEGGSTITQQLVDNTLLGKQKTLQRKVMQALYAIGIYDTVSKTDVLTLPDPIHKPHLLRPRSLRALQCGRNIFQQTTVGAQQQPIDATRRAAELSPPPKSGPLP